MKPTVARIVHYYTQVPQEMSNGAGIGPYPAIITQVFEDTTAERDTVVNLKVFPPGSEPYDESSVYEKGQAAKYGADCFWVWPPRE